MQLTFEPARLTGFAILAVAGATALSVGACSSSHDAKSPATSSPAAAKGKDSVHGLIASVSGNAVQVTETTGTATVDVSPSTKVTENTRAQLTDVAAGNCVNVVGKPAPAPGGPAHGRLRASGPGRGVTASARNRRPDRSQGDRHGCFCGGQHHQRDRYRRQRQSRLETDVTVTDKTHYSKGAAATSQAIAQGKCITARGTKDGGGTLQATVVSLGPANDKGECPQPAAKQQPH